VITSLLPSAQLGRSVCTTWLLSCGVLLAPLALTAAEVRIELPPETAAFKPGPGSEIANGQCLTCHSVEYVTTQPPLPGTFWMAEVNKMQTSSGPRFPIHR